MVNTSTGVAGKQEQPADADTGVDAGGGGVHGDDVDHGEHGDHGDHGVLAISCDGCVGQGTSACDDCVVTFLCGADAGEAVVVDVGEARALRLLAGAGLVPVLRHRRRTA